MAGYFENHKPIRFAAILAVLLLAFIPVAIHPAASATQTSTGLLIPLYEYPTDSSWTALIQAKESYPNVPIIAIIDPTSTGPGRSSDPNFAAGIENLQAAGIVVIGYIGTNYGSESLSTVDSWTADYQSWYHVNGIFFDEMSVSAGDASYYSSASAYANSIGLSLTYGNPGTNVPSDYIGTVSTLCIYEDSGYPSASTISSYAMGDSRNNFAMIAFGVSVPTQSYLSSVASYVSYVYFTNESGGNPYSELPSYLTPLMSMLASMDGAGATTTTSSTSSTSSTSTSTTGARFGRGGSFVVQSDSLNGNPINGLWTTIQTSSGATAATGYTPLTFQGKVGAQYTVTVSSSGNDIFNHWDSGSTVATQTVTLNQSNTLTAYYSTSSNLPVSYPLAVDAYRLSGASITGLWVEVYSSSGNLVASGYTPLTYTGTVGATYSIAMSNYRNYVFSNWANGSTTPTDTIALSQATTLSAYYRT